MNVNFVNGSIDFIYLHHQKNSVSEANKSSERSEDDWIKSPWSNGWVFKQKSPPGQTKYSNNLFHQEFSTESKLLPDLVRDHNHSTGINTCINWTPSSGVRRDLALTYRVKVLDKSLHGDSKYVINQFRRTTKSTGADSYQSVTVRTVHSHFK